MKLIGIIASSLLKFITDSFTRTTSGSLGVSTSGSLWQAIRGVWFANGTQAQSTDAASTYPIASIPFRNNATVSASVSEGTGVAFWVSDANNWYATVSYGASTPYSCGCSTCCYTCTHTGGSCGSTCNTCSHSGGSCGTTTVCNTCTYVSSVTQTCQTGSYLSGGYCYFYTNDAPCCSPSSTNNYTTGANCTACGSSQQNVTCTNSDCSACGSTANTCTNSDCSACGSYSCGCTTCYSNAYYMRMLKSVAGTVSNVISDVALASAAAALKVVTLNGTITEYAYSNTAMTTQIGTATTTPVSPVVAPGVGIIKATTGVSQGSTVDDFAVN